jgi:hypothetical protein
MFKVCAFEVEAAGSHQPGVTPDDYGARQGVCGPGAELQVPSEVSVPKIRRFVSDPTHWMLEPVRAWLHRDTATRQFLSGQRFAPQAGVTHVPIRAPRVRSEMAPFPSNGPNSGPRALWSSGPTVHLQKDLLLHGQDHETQQTLDSEKLESWTQSSLSDR